MKAERVFEIGVGLGMGAGCVVGAVFVLRAGSPLFAFVLGVVGYMSLSTVPKVVRNARAEPDGRRGFEVVEVEAPGEKPLSGEQM